MVANVGLYVGLRVNEYNLVLQAVMVYNNNMNNNNNSSSSNIR